MSDNGGMEDEDDINMDMISDLDGEFDDEEEEEDDDDDIIDDGDDDDDMTDDAAYNGRNNNNTNNSAMHQQHQQQQQQPTGPVVSLEVISSAASVAAVGSANTITVPVAAAGSTDLPLQVPSSASASASASTLQQQQQQQQQSQQLQSQPTESTQQSTITNSDSNSNSLSHMEPSSEEASAIARRRAIQQIMANKTISEQEKRMQIQQLMSQNRLVVTPAPSPMLPSHMNGTNNNSMNGASSGIDGNSNNNTTTTNAACVHYERNCNIVSPCCNRVFGCRICHDELSPPGHPPMNRYDIAEIICKNCHTRQSSKTNTCINCSTVFGEYYCSICNLWMSKARKPFHCHECGFCRVGGMENFRHCSECCMCIAATVYQSHFCLKDKYKNNCPVCHDDMFSSRQAPQDLPCGHAIHAHCFRKLAGFDYRCPICKKTVVSQQSMSAAWEARARDIADHPMPPDLQRVVDIICNDCENRSSQQQWHFLGIQCPRCSSFNTVVEQVISSGGTATTTATTTTTSPPGGPNGDNGGPPPHLPPPSNGSDNNGSANGTNR